MFKYLQLYISKCSKLLILKANQHSQNSIFKIIVLHTAVYSTLLVKTCSYNGGVKTLLELNSNTNRQLTRKW